MKSLSIASAMALAIFLAGCGGSHEHSADSEAGINITPDQLSTVIDPVCKMSMENTAIADTATHQGKLYGFCNTGCKEAFLEDPQKFLDS